MASTRILELLSLLQSRRHWQGGELARRLEVSSRTLRRDVGSLQDLGYPIVTTRGTGGGYQLAPGTALPPLVVSEEEAAAIVIGLKDVASSVHPTISAAAVSALAKIVQVLPVRIRRRIDSLGAMTVSPPREVSTTAIEDVAALTTVALSCRDTETLEFTYRGPATAATTRTVHPHRLVNIERRLYLVAYDPERVDWRTFRIDRIENPQRTGKRFVPRDLPANDPIEFVRDGIQAMPTRYLLHATVQAPANEVCVHIADHGRVESNNEESCTVWLSADSLDWATFSLGAIDAPFTVHSPPEAAEYIRAWGKRLIAATEMRG